MDARYLLFVFGLVSWTSAQQLQLHCPGDASISCLTAIPVIWDGTTFNGQCPINAISFQEVTTGNIGETFSCGELSVTITNVDTTVDAGINVTEVNSSLSFNAQPSLNGLTVHCRTGANIKVNVELLIPDISTSNVSVSQDSLTAVTVTLTVRGDSSCASLYFVEITPMGSIDQPIVMNSSSPVISVSGLDLCMNRYSVVGFVEAPSGVQGGRSEPQEIQVDLSGLRGVENVTETTSMLEWDQLPNSCIIGYIISWPGGNVIRDGTTTTTISATELNANGFPYCLTITVTVTPNTPVGTVASGASSASVLFQHPGLVMPVVSAAFSLLSDGSFQITVGWQPISINGVTVERMFGFVEVGMTDCEPRFRSDESGNSGSQVVSGARPGDQYRVCVKFVSNECMVSATINETVPPVVFNRTQTTPTGDNGFSVTVTLPPSPPMSPDTLSILSTINPPHASAVLADYPTSSQYTVVFDGLTSGTTYIYDIRVVLRSDPTTTIGLPLTGVFIVSACGTVCVTVVVVVVCVLVVAVLSLAGGFCAYKYKNRSKDRKERSSKSEDGEKHKLTHSSPPPPPDSLYADPNTIEHQAAPGTEDQYAMVDRKVKKNTKPKPTPPEALYQDPSTIEHKTASSGDTYAVVDKRSSKKKGGPDVVPPASEGLTYADIDLSSKRPKPGSGRQAPQQPGEYPKEHPVEYSSVDHGNTSQL